MIVWKKLAFSAAVAAVIGGGASSAQAEPRTVWGIRSGFTSDPGTFDIGMHLNFLHLWADAPRLEMEPSIEVGFGDNDLTIVRLNGNLRYPFVVGSRQPLEFYPVGGVSFVRYEAGNADNTEFGLNLGGGVRSHGLAGELSFGVGDIPEITITGMYTFDLP